MWSENHSKEIRELKESLVEAKQIITKMLPLLPAGYDDMGNTYFVFEIRADAEQFLYGDKM